MSFLVELIVHVLFIFARAGLRKTVHWFLIFESILIVIDEQMDKFVHLGHTTDSN